MFFGSLFTNYFIKNTSVTNLDRDPGNVIDPPPNAFELGLEPTSLNVANLGPANFTIGLPPEHTNVFNPTPSSFTIGLPPKHTNVQNLGPANFTIGLPPKHTNVAQPPALPTFDELKIFNGASESFNLGSLIAKVQLTPRNYAPYTTVDAPAGQQGTMGDGRMMQGEWNYTTFYEGIVTDAIRASIEAAINTMTHIGLVVGRRLPCKPSGVAQINQLSIKGATIMFSVIPESHLNTGGGVGI
jgi:hypothetical protein